MKWEKIIIVVVSAAFAVILYILLPVESEKYRLRLENETSFTQVTGLLYADMDGDGKEELIRRKEDTPVPAVVVQKMDYQVIDQWNMKGVWIKDSELSLSDFDHDGFKEIVCFTFHRDSVWIHVIEPMQAGGTVIHKPLERVRLYNGNQDWQVFFSTPVDMNGDGYKEYIISIYSGFTIQPRGIYLFDPYHNDLISTDRDVGNNIHTPLVIDLDGDGLMEITGNMSAPGNIIDKEVFLTDSCSWLVVYDHLLHFKTAPIAYPGKPSYLKMLPLQYDHRQLLVTHFFSRREDSLINLIEVREWVDDTLRVVSSGHFDHKSQVQLLGADIQGSGCFNLIEGDDIVKLNELLEERKRIKLDHPCLVVSKVSLDVDGDQQEERIIYSGESELTIMQNDYSHPVSINLGLQAIKPQISVFTEGRNRYINVYRGNQNLKLSYKKNPLYPFRFFILLLSFAAYYFIFTVITNYQRLRIEKRHASEREVLQYQLANVMQQLDPHFLFNALTSISSYYNKGKKEYAQDYIAKISKLIRASMENSEKMTISLTEELRFVRDYLTVEGIRMGDRFDYVIDLEEEVIERVRVPKMLIQNFVENAMKHGVRHLTDRKGIIRIYASGSNGSLQICVEDNGVGRRKAGEIGSFGTGNGLNIVRKTLDIYEQLKSVRITFEIVDLYDENSNPSGTRVELTIPMQQR